MSMQSERTSLRQIALRGMAEGILWAVAFWVKPFIAVVALGCWMVSTALVLRRGNSNSRKVVIDAAGLIAGGLLVIGLGCAWLWWSGSWPFFLEAMSWGTEYYQRSSAGVIGRTASLVQQFLPWGWVHVVAVPIALSTVWRAIAKREFQQGPEALLSSLYVGWLLQANYVQYGFPYHLAPATLLAVAVVAAGRWLPGPTPLGSIVLVGFVALAAARHPLADFGRTALWTRCVREGASPEIRNRLALSAEPVKPDWEALDQVADFLKKQGLRDRELTCYSFTTTGLYVQLELAPSTRFNPVDEWVYFFPSHKEAVREALAASPQRYIVTDVSYVAARPQSPGEFPYSEPVVFRAGQYLVHRSTGMLGGVRGDQ